MGKTLCLAAVMLIFHSPTVKQTGRLARSTFGAPQWSMVMRRRLNGRRMEAGAMRCLMALLAAIAIVISPVRAHQPGVADEDQAIAHEVEAFREFIKRAIEKRDARALRAIYADIFTHTHGSGKIDGKDAHIRSVLAGDPVIETAPVEEMLYRVFGNHTIVVTGKSPIRSRTEKTTHQFRWIAVYVKVGADWKIAASQATPLP
jgi:hypothetical protein